MTEYERNIAVNGLRDDVVKLASQATCIHKGILAGSLEDVLQHAEILLERAHTYESDDNCTATRAALKIIDNHVEAMRMLAEIDAGETVVLPAEQPAEQPAEERISIVRDIRTRISVLSSRAYCISRGVPADGDLQDMVQQARYLQAEAHTYALNGNRNIKRALNAIDDYAAKIADSALHAGVPADAPADATAGVPAADVPAADIPWWTPAETMIAAWAKSSGYKCAAYTGSHPIVYNIHSSYIKGLGKTLDDIAAEARALPGVRVDVCDGYIAIAPVPADAPTPAPVLDADVIAAALQPAEAPAEEPSIMDRLQAISGLDISAKKSTIWISGQTYPARAQLKALGCRWSAKRKAWYYQAPRPAAAIPDGLTVVKQTSACTWVDGPTDLLQAAGAKGSAKRQAWYVA